jgi:pantothenate kinase type III
MVLAAGATLQFQHESIVIDAGTCVTYDFIDIENNYLGGAISPGLGDYAMKHCIILPPSFLIVFDSPKL